MADQVTSIVGDMNKKVQFLMPNNLKKSYFTSTVATSGQIMSLSVPRIFCIKQKIHEIKEKKSHA